MLRSLPKTMIDGSLLVALVSDLSVVVAFAPLLGNWQDPVTGVS